MLKPFPITESQREIWLSHQLSSEAACSYNESFSLSLIGSFNLQAFKQAVQELIQRHESLRLIFDAHGESFFVLPELTIDIPLLDYLPLTPEAKQQQYNKLLHQEATSFFNVEQGPLLRIKIIRWDEQKHIILFIAHHIICDGWSWGILFNELSQLYSALVNQKPCFLKEAPRFSEYALALHRQAQSPEITAAIEKWKEWFSGEIQDLDLPTDFNRPAMRIFFSNRLDVEIDAQLVAKLQSMAVNLGCTLANLLLAAFEVLFYRITSQEEFSLGVPFAGQVFFGMEELVGHCVNLLPLKTKVNPLQPFDEYLYARRSVLLEAYDIQRVGYGKILQSLEIRRDASRIPLIPITLNVEQSIAESSIHFSGLETEVYINPKPFHNFEISINLTKFQGNHRFEVNYNTTLFRKETIQKWFEIFLCLLNGILQDPKTPVYRLPLMTEAEKEVILHQWNNTQSNYPREASIAVLFEKTAKQFKNATAIKDQSTCLTYDQLNQLANFIAHTLISKGTKKGDIIAVSIERSWQFVSSLLGILKSGAAYLPLDPQYPSKRTEFILHDAQTKLLITQHHQNSKLSQLTNIDIIIFDDMWEDYKNQNQQYDTPQVSVSGDDLAYIMYTSGSTGEPKGTLIPQRGISRLVLNTNYLSITPQDIIGCESNPAFDAITFEIFGALLNGAQLTIIDHDTLVNTAQLDEFLAREKITILWQTAALFNHHVAEDASIYKSLRALLFGGEAATPKWVKKLCDTYKPPLLINGYGPTENTTFTTTYNIESVADNVKSIPIGYPISNTQVYLLDAFLQPVPVGVVGELYIGGDGLAMGYLNRDSLTKEVFIPHPFSPDKNVKLYKSGDCARYLPNGAIDFLGRKDQQVKIHGFRIELEEIQAALLSHPAIKEAIVTIQKQGDEEKRILVYYVSDQPSELTPLAIRSFLSQSLPDYMLPYAYIPISSIPITPNGKVAYSALPLPDSSHTITSSEVTYLTPLERELAKIWSELLNMPVSDPQALFFSLGGHSLTAARIVSRINQLFSIKLSLRTFLEAGTISQLAAEILKKEEDKKRIEEVLYQLSYKGSESSDNSKPIFFCFGGGMDLARLAVHLENKLRFHVFEWDAHIKPEKSFFEMAQTCLDELKAIQPKGPYWLGGFCFGGYITLALAQLLISQNEVVKRVLIFDTQAPSLVLDKFGITKTNLSLMAQKAKFHTKHIQTLSFKERLPYLFSRLYSFIERSVLWQLWNVLYLYYKTSGKKIPSFLLNRDFAFYQAMSNFQLQSIPVSLTLFLAKDNPPPKPWEANEDPREEWSNIVSGGVEVYEVSGTHQTLFQEPHVSQLAELVSGVIHTSP